MVSSLRSTPAPARSLVRVLLGCLLGAHPASAQSSPAFPAFDRYLADEVAAGHLVGVHGLVYRNGRIVYDRVHGLRDREAGIPMRGDELYAIQSMTKPIASVALMILYDEGRFRLDDPVARFLPEFRTMQVVRTLGKGRAGGTRPTAFPITIRQLLSHTAGMTHGITGSTLDRELQTRVIRHPGSTSLGARISALAGFPLMVEPGREWMYSMAPDVSARLVEVLSGMPFETFLRTRLFTPLGMRHTGFTVAPDQRERVMPVYAFRRDSTLNRLASQPRTSGVTVHAGVAGLFSTTHDYLAFAGMLLNRGTWNGVRILKPETVDLLQGDATTGLRTYPIPGDRYRPLGAGLVLAADGSYRLEPGYGFGLGFAILTDPGRARRPDSALGEYFWFGSNSTYFFINPRQGIVALLMTQVAALSSETPPGFGFSYRFSQRMREAIYGDLIELPPG